MSTANQQKVISKNNKAPSKPIKKGTKQNTKQPTKPKTQEINKVKKNPHSDNKSTKKNIKEKVNNMNNEELITAGYIVVALYMLFLLYRYLMVLIYIQPVVISNNPIFIILASALPFGLWVYSTKYDKFSFHKRKKMSLYLICTSAIGTIIQPLVYISYTYLVTKWIVGIKVTENMTVPMIINLARFAIIIPLIIGGALIGIPLKDKLQRVEFQEKLESFKIQHYVDMRKDKDYKYDMSVMKDLKTGRAKTIKENDRFLHLFINGASGTGKTSSTIVPAIANDLDKKLQNKALREEVLLDMVKTKKCYVVGPVKDITEYNVKPYKKYEEEYQDVYKKYPDCGVTVMAPDTSLNDDIVKLCEARKITCNIIDPSKIYTNKYTRRRGINPFYIDIELSENDRLIAINEAATAFTQVILTANQTQGPGDPYFGEINDSVTTNIAIAVMLANSINRTQTNITEIQQCINNFDDLLPYIKTIEEFYQINVQTTEFTKPGQNNSSNVQAQNIKNIGSVNNNKNSGRDNKYYQTIQFIKQELLGAGKEKMYDQARGLRNLINFILRDPRYMELLSVSQDNAINFELILQKCEVTVINTALEFGQKKSTAFGLFNLLNLAIAVKKRLGNKEDMMNPHFLWIDEASQWMHPVYDELINLWRKYKVSGTLAMQSVSQMEKSSQTAYLKEVILKAGTQIVFGRVSAEEMKMYSDMAGVTKEEMVQRTTSHSSLFSENASQNVSERTTPNNANNLEGSNIRIRDFQEVSVFTVDEGRVVPAYIAKLSFAPKSAFLPQKVTKVQWKKYVKNKKEEARLVPEAKKIRIEQTNVIEDNRTNVEIVENIVEQPLNETPIDKTVDIGFMFDASIFEDEAVEDTTFETIEELDTSADEES